jgi:hypothetical protein
VVLVPVVKGDMMKTIQVPNQAIVTEIICPGISLTSKAGILKLSQNLGPRTDVKYNYSSVCIETYVTDIRNYRIGDVVKIEMVNLNPNYMVLVDNEDNEAVNFV